MSHQTFIFWERNPTIRWVDFKTTHQLDGCTQNLQMPVHYLGPIKKLHVNLLPFPFGQILILWRLYPLRRGSHNASVGQSQQNLCYNNHSWNPRPVNLPLHTSYPRLLISLSTTQERFCKNRNLETQAGNSKVLMWTDMEQITVVWANKKNGVE
jgi:hypothetical protein